MNGQDPTLIWAPPNKLANVQCTHGNVILLSLKRLSQPPTTCSSNCLNERRMAAAAATTAICIFWALFSHLSFARGSGAVGVNWGTSSSHPLPPPKVVELLQSNDITKVKLSDANPHVLDSLSRSRIDVTVGIPNEMLRSLNSSKKAAERWVRDNITFFISDGGSSGVRIQ